MKRKSFIQYSIVFLLLVIFPAISWLYLRKGLHYRQDLMEELSPVSDYVFKDTSCESRICILAFRRDTALDPLQPIKNLFANQDSVMFLEEAWNELNDDLEDVWTKCFTDLSEDSISRIFLVNQQGHIVNCYRGSEEEDLVSLPEHIAFLLPSETRKTLLYKRERER
jgi:hypothetical protein